MINFSIIIPHRDNLQQLKVALSSIPQRNDIEVLVIDNSEVPIDFKKHESLSANNVKFYHSNNTKGAGHARNIGIKNSTGVWTLFLDADDFFINEAFSEFDKFKDSDFDLVYFKSDSGFINSTRKSKRHIFYSNLVSNFLNNKKKSLDKLRYKYGPPWGKLIKRDLLKNNNIWFDEVPASNDIMFSTKVGHFAKQITAVNSEVYFITESSNSLTKTITIENSRSRFKVAINYYLFMKNNNRKDQLPYLLPRVLDSLRFGYREFFLYLNYAYKNKINIFLGSYRYPFILLKYCFLKLLSLKKNVCLKLK